ncbi:Clp protease ClpP [Exiguobacterium sp. SH5S4]|uniref:head maturation protease, ClpP-related n=1 Tax=Exiguobacterium sp. SH5S4 TaxID=2510961 RepID=UPI001039B494|nr:head maturation protease, ClpP-related [Exiguobacterium sp. SH5S4]TCI25564.1 Clp protease ClpP [Exiguobacterium sp. SH5S4]
MKIKIKGPIVSNSESWIYEWFGMEHTSAKSVTSQIENAGTEELLVEINSPGGSVFDASEIYTALKSYKGNVEVQIVGLAASAASIIAMAGDRVLMSPTAQMMIHNASAISGGDHRDMKHTSDFLQGVDRTIADAYAKKSGLDYQELLAMMADETWLTPDKAKEVGLIDAVMFEEEAPKVVASFDASNGGLLPQSVIERIRNELGPKLGKAGGDGDVQPDPENLSKEDDIVNIADLKNKHPELYEQLLNEGVEVGVKNENERIKSIDALKKPGGISNEEFSVIVNEAKADPQATAGDLAVKILNHAAEADSTQRNNYLENVKKDAEALNNVPGSHQKEDTKNDQTKEAADLIASNFAGTGGN